MLNYLYNNIGKKNKGLAKTVLAITTIGIIICALVFLVLILSGKGYNDLNTALIAILIVISVPLAIALVWVSTWGLYAFGDIADRLANIDQNIFQISVKKTTKQLDQNTMIESGAFPQLRRIQRDSSCYNIKNFYYQKKASKLDHVEFVINEDTSYVCPICRLSNDALIPCERCGFTPTQE